MLRHLAAMLPIVVAQFAAACQHLAIGIEGQCINGAPESPLARDRSLAPIEQPHRSAGAASRQQSFRGVGMEDDGVERFVARDGLLGEPALRAPELRRAPRPRTRAEPTLVRRVSASHAGRVFPAEPGQPRLLLSGLDLHRRSVLEGKLPPLDGRAARVRSARRTDRHGRRCRLHLSDCTASA